MYSNLAITYLQDNIVFVTVAVEVLMRRKNPIHLSPVHTGDKVDCCQNRRQIGNKVDCRRYGRLRCRFWRQISNQQLEFDSLSPSTLSPTQSILLPIRSTLSPVCNGLYLYNIFSY